MQRGREGKRDLFDAGDPFDVIQRLGSFGSRGTMMSSLFGGRDPFDDPFFTRPFDSMFEPSLGGNGIHIEELNSDEEDDETAEGITKHVGSGKEPSIQHPDDSDDDGKIQSVTHRNEHDSHRVKGSNQQARSFSFQTSRVTYGGVDGTYYTSTKSRKKGCDGVVMEERKEADTTTGQATHKISRGIHDKGHSVTRKLNADGKVDTTQALHNMNGDELAEFEKAWKGKSDGHFTGWSDGFSKPANAGPGSHEQMGLAVKDSWRHPYREQGENSGNQGANTARTTSGGRTKKVVRINIE
ncbi:uncharacterized protein LOC120208351 [Hibiscus syriacus]|uniref:uncharacterized protein LOC120208351 n=1 Tax=Hibiscus syriacus TaxID=106335 RepID=UPI001922E624|nr:uncharacterized protein LOC120208351 [Hibiscus syriacus]